MAGVYYAATELEARQCAGSAAIVVGGGNSAGQAAMFLAEKTSSVCVVVRRPLSETMSRYLVDRIEAHLRVQVREGTAVTGLHGDPLLERVTLTGPEGTVEADCRALFSFIGAEPNSGWLGSVTVDEHGFVLTDRALDADALGEEWATTGRLPLPYETSRPGLFAVGDLRRIDEASGRRGWRRVGLDPLDPRAPGVRSGSLVRLRTESAGRAEALDSDGFGLIPASTSSCVAASAKPVEPQT